jgi:hypothetical protein
MNLAAVIVTDLDSTAIIYDAGLISKESAWEDIFWSNTENYL